MTAQVGSPIKVRSFKGAEEICAYINEDPRTICRLVQEEKLPAWKRDGRGPWRALDIDLDAWMIGQRKRYFGQKINQWEET